MTDEKNLLKKIEELENRINKIEEKLALLEDPEEKALMDVLYQKAKELIKKHHKASVIFLQKKMMIDYPRATKIFKELKKEHFIPDP